MNQNYPLFVGYLTLEEWLKVVDGRRPVYALQFTEPGVTGQYDSRTDRMLVEVVQPEAHGEICHYCCLPVGQLRYQGGEPFDSDHKQRLARADNLWRVVETWLDNQGLVVQHGKVSMPADLVKTRGWGEFIEFDKAEQVYRIKSLE